MRRDAQSRQIIHDEAVEHPTEEVLCSPRKGCSKTEHRVRRDRACWNDAGYQRDAICGTCHVAIPKPGVAPPVAEEAGGFTPPDRMPRICDLHPERLE